MPRLSLILTCLNQLKFGRATIVAGHFLQRHRVRDKPCYVKALSLDEQFSMVVKWLLFGVCFNSDRL